MEHWAFAKSAATATNTNARIQLEYMLNLILTCHTSTLCPCIPGTTLGRALAQIDGDRRVDKPVSNWTLQNVSLIPLDSVPKYGV